MAEFRKLLVWQKAHKLALNANRVSTSIRGAAHASLRNQLLRAAMSVPANIVEGRSQKSERDFARFLAYAIGSAFELEYHLVIARDISAITESDYQTLLNDLVEVRKMLHGLKAKLRKAVS